MSNAVLYHAPLLIMIGFLLAWIADVFGMFPARKKHAGFYLDGYNKYCTQAMELCRQYGLSGDDSILLMNKHRKGGVESLRSDLAQRSAGGLTEGPTMRNGFGSGPSTPKLSIMPQGQGVPVKPSFPPPRKIREDFL